MPRKIKLLIATTNKHKHSEIRTILKKSNLFEFVPLSNFKNIKEVNEDGKSFIENAAKKALGYAAQTSLVTLAEDSGLCVNALNDAPGIYSARYAGLHKSDLDNCLKILDVLRRKKTKDRRCRYVCALVLARPGQVIAETVGYVHGKITHEMKGSGGFGYDPLFYYPAFGRTFGEVSSAMKNKVSHRFKGLIKMRMQLAHIYSVLAD